MNEVCNKNLLTFTACITGMFVYILSMPIIVSAAFIFWLYLEAKDWHDNH